MPVAAAIPVAAILDKALSLLGFVGDKLLDPALNDALSPSSGLSVAPHYFQSVEQEGRWKDSSWGFNKERELVGLQIPHTTKAGSTTYKNPWGGVQDVLGQKWRSYTDSVVKSQATGGVGATGNAPISGKTSAFRIPLLDINIKKPSWAEQAVLDAITAIIGTPLGGAVGPVVLRSILAPGSLVIDANWVCDGTEIHGGVAGLAWANGFQSLFGHRAKVEISGVSFGNYLPTAYLLGMSGYINPVGPVFVEFRCGVAVFADGGASPVYGSYWTRDSDWSGDPKPPNSMAWTNGRGWAIDIDSLLSY